MPALLELHMSFGTDDDKRKLGERGPPPLGMIGSLSEWEEVHGAESFINFVRGDHREQNPLRFLHITAASFYGDVLFHLLRGLHSLTRLKLDWIELRSYTPDDSFSNLTTHTPLCLPNLKTVEILNLKHSPEYQIPSLRSFVKERNIDLTLTYHDHEAALEEKWVEDGRDAALEASCWDQKYWKIGVSSPSDSD